ncbi:MAG: signal recognition particle-docking protein FtsY [Rickettsiales bacterium]|jgi:fused signal recognition particle receptor|nr:signal recognition particle-docking protein FtsY [Rickettsiales bacterium]
MGLFKKLFAKKIDSVSAEEMSDILISADIAPDLAGEIVGRLRRSDNPKETLTESLSVYAKKLRRAMPNPKSILIVGVNGAGKTTTIGKLAWRFNAAGQKVVIGACDTFRAAADEQLDIWALRAGARIVHGHEPASVAYKTIESMDEEVALLDTAGRLHNRSDLMDELSKIVRVIKKLDESAPTDVWLVLDGTTGQNALNQIEYFNKAVPLTGLVVTKMDGTGKGGFLVSYAAREKNPLPVVYMGYGEEIEDLKPFSDEEYIDRMLSE